MSRFVFGGSGPALAMALGFLLLLMTATGAADNQPIDPASGSAAKLTASSVAESSMPGPVADAGADVANDIAASAAPEPAKNLMAEAEASEPDLDPETGSEPDLTATFDERVSELTETSFKVKEAAAQAIADSGDARAIPLLKALLAGDLYYRTADDRVVYVAPAGSRGWALTDALSGEALGEVGRRDVRKITVNNRMRGALRTAIAALTLASPDPALRLRAAREMVGSDDPSVISAVRGQLAAEDDRQVTEVLALVVAIADLKQPDSDSRLAAIEVLHGNLYPQARNALNALLESEQDPEVLAATKAALDAIDRKRQLNSSIETLFFGLSLGSVLVLAAIGLAITFGVMGVINMAHGELIMIGAYTTYLVQQAMPGLTDWSLLVAVPAAFLVSGAFGVAIERTVIRFLYGRPLETLLATFGISLILQQLVRTTISAQNVVVQNPSWMSGSLQLNPGLALTYNRLYILLFALIVFALLLLVLKRTALGLQVRAVSQNRAMARAMGVHSARVDALTFGLGAGIAGVAGVALSQLTNVGPNMGQAYIIDSFMVVVFGGVGNLWGTLVAGMTLGVANKLMEPWAGAVLAKILVLVFIILFIQKRPRGLFPQRGRAAAD
ncbi:urea ABC transporter permease subunit UrtB [Halochromatium roseum]|uniref:urea ABC transporter permease subunit UrtB n=1 Tax=Halochromatium roseum TaxID=391920 RepID=UPI001F5DFEF0|nr:urea ABC transporter permease subunit UrtB [Halochromatium roseum]